MRRQAMTAAAGFFVLILLLLVIPTGALAASSTTIVVTKSTIPSTVPAPGVDTDGRYVLCFGYNNDLLCRDLQTNQEIAIPGAGGDGVAANAALADGTCIWQPSVWAGELEGYDITTGQSFTIDANPSVSSLVIGGGMVAWSNGDGKSTITGYDLATRTPLGVCPNADAIREVTGVTKGLVVWDEARTLGNTDIWGELTATQTSFAICTDPATQCHPVTDGRTVAWLDMRDGQYYDVWAYDLASKRTFRMSAAARCNDTSALDADGGVFVWADSRDNSTSVRGYYMPSHTEFVIRPESGTSLVSAPRVAHNLVVWDEQVGTVTTLCGARLHEWVCSISAPRRTAKRTVTVTVSSKASAAKVTRMRFSVNGGRWSAWTAFRHTHPLVLKGAVGTKKVRVELRDVNGHLSRPAATSVRLL